MRLERHEANARAVARYLADDPRVEWVSFAGFEDHPYFRLAERYWGGHVPSIITFGVLGGYDAGLRFFDSLELFKRLLNLGDAKSLAIHPCVDDAPAIKRRRAWPPPASDPKRFDSPIGLEHVDDLPTTSTPYKAARLQPRVSQ